MASSAVRFPIVATNLHFNKTSPPTSLNPFGFIGISSAVLMSRALVAKAAESSESNSTGPLVPNTPDGNKVNSSNGTPVQKFPFWNNFPGWLKWIAGSLFLIALPYYRKILTIEDKVEKAAKNVLDAVEKVAEVTEKIAEEVAENLPEDSTLRQVALKVDMISEKIGDHAERVEDFVDKVDDAVDDVAAAVEPVVETMKVGTSATSKSTVG